MSYDTLAGIMDYEEGTIGSSDMLLLFSHLIRTGQVWTLQGHYGRMAYDLIGNGYLNTKGDILRVPEDN